jgi:predicted RNase H-like nuclease
MSMMGRPKHGPNLPYSLVAGVVPCGRAWLVASAKLQGATIAPEQPRLLRSFVEVLDERPGFTAVGLYAPVGLLDDSVVGGRSCDREARALLGSRRGAAIRSAPSRAVLNNGATDGTHVAKDGPTRYYEAVAREVAREMAPYRQRTVFEVNPELTFYQLNDDRPLLYRKRSMHGQRERRTLLDTKIPGVERILDARITGVRRSHLIDATACMWTARRIFGKAMTRVPQDPEWDNEGLRMEIVR